MHNAILTYVNDNFSPSSEIKDYNEGKKYLASLMNGGIEGLNISLEKKETLTIHTQEYVPLYNHNFYKQGFSNVKTTIKFDEEGENLNLREMYQYIRDNNIINESEYQIILSIIELTEQGLQQTITDTQLEESINSLISQWEINEYKEEDNDGLISAPILAIAESSYEWWDKSHITDGTKAVTVSSVVTLDIAGALLGAATNTIKQLSKNRGTDNFNWKTLADSTLTTAVFGSVGAVGRVAKWLNRLSRLL